MNLIKAKYSLLAAAIGLAACNKNDDGDDGQTPSNTLPVENAMTFKATFENPLSKAALHVEGKEVSSAAWIKTYFQSGDAMSLFSNAINNKFTTSDNGETVSFSGAAKESEDGYIALFPYSQDATINDDGTISTKIPETQSFKDVDVTTLTGFNKALEGIVAVAKTAPDKKELTLKNATTIANFSSSRDLKSLKVEASQPIAGDITITLDDSGIPTVTSATSTTIELTDAPKGGYISMAPNAGIDLKVTYTLDDTEGTTKSVYMNNVNMKRSNIIDFGDITTLVSITYDVSAIPDATPEKSKSVVNGNNTISMPNTTGVSLWVGEDGTPYRPGEIIKNVTTDLTFAALPEGTKAVFYHYYDEVKPVIFKEGETVTMLDVTPNQEGYDFLGWATAPQNTTIAYDPGASVVLSTTSNVVNLYAKFALRTVTITFDANGGKFDDGNTIKTVDHQYNTSISLYLYIPKRDGFWFKNWEGHDDPGINTTDITLKAIWGDYFTVTYHDFDGSVAGTQQVRDGEEAIVRADLSLSSIVETWTSQPNGQGTEYIPGQEAIFTGNIDLYPVKSNNTPSTIQDWTIDDGTFKAY